MTNEEVQEIVAKADAEYDRLKDKVHEQYDEIKRLKEQLNDEIQEELKQSEIMVKQQQEIEKLTFESTKWESKFYDEAKKVDKAIHRIQLIQMDGEVNIRDLTELVNILKGSDKE